MEPEECLGFLKHCDLGRLVAEAMAFIVKEAHVHGDSVVALCRASEEQNPVV